MLPTIRIFISSPGDVESERKKARDVIDGLQRHYADQVHLETIMWEDLPLGFHTSFQASIDKILSAEHHIDIAVFILWSRLGTPMNSNIKKPDNSEYRSGTEREFDLMLAAHEATEGEWPHLLAYVRQDNDVFLERLKAQPQDKYREFIEQRDLAKQFIEENFHDERGRSLRAYHTFPEPITFASRFRVHLRALIDARLEGEELQTARWTEEPPYLALDVFELRHADIFHGREHETAELESLLRQRAASGCAFVVVLGASGSGKSSLARAGLAASLINFNLDETVAHWRQAIFTPSAAGGQLVHGLVQALVKSKMEGEPDALVELLQGGVPLDQLAANLATSPQSVVDLAIVPAFLRAAKTGGPVRLLLIVDQLEELFTGAGIALDQRAQFFGALHALATSGYCWIVATLRSDFYSIAQKDDGFLALKGQDGQFDLVAPGPSALGQMITAPARLAGLRFESDPATGRKLNEILLDDACQQKDALPLLEFTLRELYERREDQRVLKLHTYRETLGGISGAIGQHAKSVFEALPEDVQRSLPGLLQRLVTTDPEIGLRAVRQRAPYDAKDTSPEGTLITELIKGRLLTADRQGDQATVALAHDSLLQSWPLLAQWIKDNRKYLRIRARLEQSRAAWDTEADAANKASLLLPAGLPLEEGRTLLKEARVLLTREQVAYIEASIAHHAAKARRRMIVRSAVIAAISLLAVVALRQWSIAAKRYRESTAMLLVRNADDRLRDSKIELPVLLAGAAYEMSPGFETRSALLRALHPLSPFLITSLPGDADGIKGINALAWNEKAHLVAAGDQSGNVSFWDTRSSRLLGRVPPPASADDSSADGMKGAWAVKALHWHNSEMLDCVYENGHFARLALTPQPQIAVLRPLQTRVRSALFSPDGSRVVLASTDEGGARLHTVERLVSNSPSGDPEPSPFPIDGRISAFAFSPDQARVAVGTEEGSLSVWQINGERVDVPRTSPTEIQSLAWSSAAPWLAVGDVAQNPNNPKLNSQHMLHLSNESAIEIYDVTKGKEPRRLTTRPVPGKSVTSLAWHPTQYRLAFAGGNRDLTTWSFDQGGVPASQAEPAFRGHEAIALALTWSADGTILASGSDDRTVKLWQMDPAAGYADRLEAGQPLYGLAVSPDGKWLAAGGDKGEVLVWDLSSHKLARRLPPGPQARVNTLAWHPKEPVLAAGDENGSLFLWRWPGNDPPTRLEGHPKSIWKIRWSPDGQTLASSSYDGRILLWPFGGGPPRSEIKNTDHEVYFLGMAISPNGQFLASGSTTGEIWLWDISSSPPQKIWKIPGHGAGQSPGSLDFSPDGKRLASASNDGTVALWESATGKHLHTFPSRPGYVESVAFSRDGRFLASGGADGVLRAWDATALSRYFEIHCHEGHIWNVTWLSDGKTIASASEDGAVQLLPIDEAGWTQRIKTATNRSLTKKEWEAALGRKTDLPAQESAR